MLANVVRHAQIALPNGRQLKTSWRFNSIFLKGNEVKYSECLLSSGKDEWAGYGESAWTPVANQKAHSEAFERFAFKCYEKYFSTSERPNSSNGFAAHPRLKTAIHHSVLELIERKVVMDAWYSLTGWSRKERLNESFVETLRSRGFTVLVFEIRNDSQYNVHAGFVWSATGGVAFDSVATMSREVPKKLYDSLMRSAAVLEQLHPEQRDIPASATPEDILNFYRNPANLGVIDYFVEEVQRRSNQEIQVASEITGIRTEVLLDSTFCTPAVVRSYHPHWRKLEWGMETVYGRNPWHLPLA